MTATSGIQQWNRRWNLL